MEYLFNAGFLGTRAPYFIDIILITISIVPFLLIIAIIVAIKEHHKLHRYLQSLLFLVTLIALLILQCDIQIRTSLETLLAQSSVNSEWAFYYYLIYSLLTLGTIVLWYSTLAFAKGDRKRRALPGLYSNSHKKRGRVASVAIILTSMTTIGLYWILFTA